MKNHIQKILTIFILIAFFNVNNAIAIEGNIPLDVEDSRNIDSKIKTFTMTWIFDLDIENLKQHNLLKKDSSLSKYSTSIINLNLNNIPNGVSRIHMYGNGSTKNMSIVIFGEVELSEIENYVRKRMQKRNDTVIKRTIINGNKKDIVKLTIQSQNDKTKELYIASFNKNLHIVSYNRYEVLAWTYNLNRFREYTKATDYNSLISFSIDIEKTLNVMHKENTTDTYMMQSKLFQQVSDINAVLRENDQGIYFGAVLRASNKNKTQVLYNTIANLLDKNYPEIKSETNELIRNMQVKMKNRSVRIGSYLDKDQL